MSVKRTDSQRYSCSCTQHILLVFYSDTQSWRDKWIWSNRCEGLSNFGSFELVWVFPRESRFSFMAGPRAELLGSWCSQILLYFFCTPSRSQITYLTPTGWKNTAYRTKFRTLTPDCPYYIDPRVISFY